MPGRTGGRLSRATFRRWPEGKVRAQASAREVKPLQAGIGPPGTAFRMVFGRLDRLSALPLGTLLDVGRETIRTIEVNP
jgi:hypothetical protein